MLFYKELELALCFTMSLIINNTYFSHSYNVSPATLRLLVAGNKNSIKYFENLFLRQHDVLLPDPVESLHILSEAFYAHMHILISQSGHMHILLLLF